MSDARARRGLLGAGVSGALAVAFGAFGAHGLEGSIGELADGATRLGWWATAADYHLAHALALGLTGAAARHASTGRALGLSQLAFALGTVLFSGSLYAMTLTGARWLGAITPIGGTLLIVGWIALAVSARRPTESAAES